MKRRTVQLARHAAATALLSIAVACAGACETEERVISVSGGLGDVPGAVGGTRATETPSDGTNSGGRSMDERMNNPMGYVTPEGVDETLRYTGPDGRVLIVSRNPRELIYHLRLAFSQRDADTLRLTLSEATRRTYIERGLDPEDAVAFMIKHAEEFQRLLGMLPMGELTPGQYARTVGRNTFRLEVPKYSTDPPLRFTRLDYVYERDGCWLVLMH